MHVYITVIVEYFLTFLALKKIKPPLVRTTAVWISHCWEMVYKKIKCITSQSCNLFPLLRTSTGRSTQRREHPKEGAPTRGNSFQMRKTWIHILNYYRQMFCVSKDAIMLNKCLDQFCRGNISFILNEYRFCLKSTMIRVRRQIFR